MPTDREPVGLDVVNGHGELIGNVLLGGAGEQHTGSCVDCADTYLDQSSDLIVRWLRDHHEPQHAATTSGTVPSGTLPEAQPTEGVSTT